MAKKQVAVQKQTSAKKVVKAAVAAVVVEAGAAPATENKLEALTKSTVETGVITFRENGGSQDLLNLIAKYGFDKAKVLAAAEKMKAAGKAFVKSNPVAKYVKVAGIIKRLQNAGYKLPQVS